ncbi:MAG: hypothetical protein KKI02_02080, partial [Planctomycetes bacterium]|nr:hypothetical protein [Planctomycetota bacterium]
MPADQAKAYRWAKHIGTLVSYETFLRQYPFGARADGIRQLIRERFVPEDERWQADWSKYARLDTISGATVHPEDGLILWGQPAEERLPPFFYDDLIVALRCLRDGDAIGVTMVRVFPARFDQPEDPKAVPSKEFETSVEFYARQLWNTHL